LSHQVFISYRRETGAAEARLLREALIGRGISVFLDVTDLRRGYFDEELLKRITAAPNFVLVLTPGALDRCADPQDWMRQEIAHAIREKRNIVPVMIGAFQFPAALPDDIVNLPRHQGIQYSHQYFDAMTQSIVESLELSTGPQRTADRGRVAVPRGEIHWSYALVAGAAVGLLGGAIDAAFFAAQSIDVDLPGLLLFCGVIPGAVSGVFVRRPQGVLPKAATGAVAGAIVVEFVFLLNFLVLGSSVTEFNNHLPFWLGPGDEHIMMGEAFMGGVLLGAVPGILTGLFEWARERYAGSRK
jgi:hypothetical protein